MATPLLLSGIPTLMAQNLVFALPARRCLFFTDAAAPTIQQSTDVGFTNNIVLTLSSGAAEVAGAFIRCTTGNITVLVKAF